MDFDIQSYLDNLPDDVLVINLEKRKLNNIPSLVRFTKLVELNCKNNKLKFLPELPKSLQVLNCAHNVITLLSDLPDGLKELDCAFNSIEKIARLPNDLTKFICNDNLLTSLPNLPANLSMLNCSFNKLLCLPILPKKLLHLYCSSNELEFLPVIPDSCTDIRYSLNPFVSEVGYNKSIKTLNEKFKPIHNFKHMYFSFKFGPKVKLWFWCKIKKPYLIKKYNPVNLQKIIDERQFDCNSNEFHEFIINW